MLRSRDWLFLVLLSPAFAALTWRCRQFENLNGCERKEDFFLARKAEGRNVSAVSQETSKKLVCVATHGKELPRMGSAPSSVGDDTMRMHDWRRLELVSARSQGRPHNQIGPDTVKLVRTCPCNATGTPTSIMLNNRTSGFPSSRVNEHFVQVSASWPRVSTYFPWSFGSRLILSDSQSSATLWVRETCLIVGHWHALIILIPASLSSKLNNKASWRESLIVFVRPL